MWDLTWEFHVLLGARSEGMFLSSFSHPYARTEFANHPTVAMTLKGFIHGFCMLPLIFNVGVQAAPTLNIYVENDCKYADPAFVAIRYQDPKSGDWVSKCWYELEYGEGYNLNTGGKRIEIDNSIVYYYAQSDKCLWAGSESGDITRTCDGRSLHMRKWDYVYNNKVTLRLICSGKCKDRRQTMMVDGSPDCWNGDTNVHDEWFFNQTTGIKDELCADVALPAEYESFIATHDKDLSPTCSRDEKEVDQHCMNFLS